MLEFVQRCWPALAFLAWTLVAGWGGWQAGQELADNRCAAALATIEAGQARTVAAALTRVRDLEKAGGKLAQQQLTLETQNAKLAKEKDRALRQATTGRACLGADAVRLLNVPAASPFGSGLRLSAPAGGSADALAAAPGPSGDGGRKILADHFAGAGKMISTAGASDTDVALWARVARTQYDLCRGRLDALRSFLDGPDDHDH